MNNERCRRPPLLRFCRARRANGGATATPARAILEADFYLDQITGNRHARAGNPRAPAPDLRRTLKGQGIW